MGVDWSRDAPRRKGRGCGGAVAAFGVVGMVLSTLGAGATVTWAAAAGAAVAGGLGRQSAHAALQRTSLRQVTCGCASSNDRHRLLREMLGRGLSVVTGRLVPWMPGGSCDVCMERTMTTPTPARSTATSMRSWSAGRWTAFCSTSPDGARRSVPEALRWSRRSAASDPEAAPATAPGRVTRRCGTGKATPPE
jgi:hypothetical protein